MSWSLQLQKKVRKGYLKKREVSSTKCATLPQSVCTSFLDYKVMQILYNKLMQAHLSTSTAKPSNSQMYHVKNTIYFFVFFFGNTFTHHTEKLISNTLLGSNIFGFLRTIYTFCVCDIRLLVWASETYRLCIQII